MTSRFLAIVIALLGAGCGSSSPSSPSSKSASTVINESFEATLSPGDSTFYSFNVNSTANVAVTLASVSQPGRPAALSVSMHIGLGTPAGEGCAIAESVDATPALTPQLSAVMAPGIHCVWVADAGQPAAPVLVSIRFSHQ